MSNCRKICQRSTVNGVATDTRLQTDRRNLHTRCVYLRIYVRRYCDGAGGNGLEISARLHVFSTDPSPPPPPLRRSGFGNAPLPRLNDVTDFVYIRQLKFVRHREVPTEFGHSSSGNRDPLKRAPQKQNGHSLKKTAATILINF